MKLNRIISSALVFVVLFTSLVTLIPVSAFAAEEKATVNIKAQDQIISDADQVKKICEEYLTYNFKTAKEMLDYELEKDYLDYVVDGDYAIYVNRYTGFVYYVNNVTGQIITSNPIDPAYQTKENSSSTVSLSKAIMSQLELEFFELSSTNAIKTYDSLTWIMDGSLLAVSEYSEKGGIAVEYILGSALDAFIAPAVLLLDTANEQLIYPMFDKLEGLLEEYCGPFDPSYASSAVTSYDVLSNDIYRTGTTDVYDTLKLRKVINGLASYALSYFNNDSFNADYKKIKTVVDYITIDILSNYSVVTPDMANNVLKESISALNDGKNVLLLAGAHLGETTLTTVRKVDKAIKYLCPEYTIDLVQVHEDECGFVSTTPDVPYFKITVCYSINDDGSLSVDIPMNLVDFDETIYSLSNVTPLKYFGAGNMDNDGYLFFPDGSGSIARYSDFYYGSTSNMINNAVYVDSKLYGSDYCYASITGAHREQLTMPVFGMVNDVKANDLGYSAAASTVTNGFFNIVEEGSSLATLGYVSGGGSHKYMSTFAKFAPYPADTYDLSQSISVSGLGAYTVVAPASFDGSLRMRYTMLVDDTIYAIAALADPEFVGYASDYVGMADCYRNYLESIGVIELLDSSYSSLPLYIEALGSMDITKKILSFPTTVSTPLTTFEDIAKMYSELSDAVKTVRAKAEENKKAADELEAENADKYVSEIERYRKLAEDYEALAEEIVDIKNINFRLTGFANGGMHFTYPAKVKWQRSVGGKSGFNELLSIADENTKAGQSFGVYPDFDFMYVNNTSAFDGIARKGTAACMVDNRYASKQTYNSVNQKFETIFALVVSSNALDKLYTKFDKQYSKYAAAGLSVSTLGSELNSNFDEDNPVVREQSLNDVKAVLARMSESYSLMTDVGNIYAVEYMDHILNAPIDSSHLNGSSYAIPFYGMVLHGYVNYAGTPINYSGSPDYDILRSIESGAALYYILCTQNTNYLKEDSLLSEYYGIDYNTWFDKIVSQYAVIDDAIGDLQNHKIVDHTIVRSERIIDEDEMAANYENLIIEFLEELDEIISDKIDTKIKEMRDAGLVGAGLKFTVSDEDFATILAVAADRINLSVEDLTEQFGVDAELKAVIAKYEADYAEGSENVTVTGEDIEYRTKYTYVTDSIATDENYVYTDFTCDNGNVVMVTYEQVVNGEKETVVFLLNYNVFSVKIKIDDSVHANYAQYVDEDGYIVLDKYGFIKIK